MNKGRAPPSPYTVPADAMKSGVGKNSGGSSPALGPSARSSASDTSLTASSSSAGTRLPTSVEERKSSTARLHLPSARRSRIFHRSFHLPVSFFTSAHRTFGSGFHSGYSLKRCSRVWCGYRHHQHCGVARLFVQLRRAMGLWGEGATGMSFFFAYLYSCSLSRLWQHTLYGRMSGRSGHAI